eukprot:PhF_6_TR503/c0_g1_i2/m.260
MSSKFDLSAIECCICLNVFNDPITLLCGHTMCHAHISQLHACPLCRTELPDAIGVNITLRDLIANMNHTCKDCGESVLTSEVLSHTTSCPGGPRPAGPLPPQPALEPGVYQIIAKHSQFAL